jgi:hypothetical protein
MQYMRCARSLSYMGRFNVLVIVPIGTSHVTRTVWDATLRKIENSCLCNDTRYVRVAKDNASGVMDKNRQKKFINVCNDAFKEATSTNEPTVIVVDCSNSDRSERLCWQQCLEQTLGPDSCHTVLFSPLDVVDLYNEAALSRTKHKDGQHRRVAEIQSRETVNPGLYEEVSCCFNQEIVPIKFYTKPGNMQRPTNDYMRFLLAKIKELKPRATTVQHTETPCVCHGGGGSAPSPHAKGGFVPISWEELCDDSADTSSRFVDTLVTNILCKLNMSSSHDSY